MCHTKHQVFLVAVFETDHFVADRRVSSRLFPQFSWHDDRKTDFLPLYGVHFFSNNVLYLFAYSSGGHSQRPYAVCYKLNKSCSNQESVTSYCRIRRVFLCSFSNKL